MAKKVTVKPAPNLVGKPAVNFMKEEFEAAVWSKGNDCIVEKAVRCPCKTKDNDHLSTCKNCLGVGWVLINSEQDRILISSINRTTQFKNWSEEMIGTVNLTSVRRTPFGYMDRITVIDSSVVRSEFLYPFILEGECISFPTYEINSILEIFQFVGAAVKLKKLELEIDYTFSGNKIMFTNDLSGKTLSLRYEHKLQYHVFDIPHIIRNSYRKDTIGRKEMMKLPVNAIARLSHFVIDAKNNSSNNILDNSYL